jgi:4,5-DOPA dioxygenase extradiol
VIPNKMPVLFAGHGSPMNAIEETQFGEALKQIGAKLPVPRSILMISAHWETSGTQAVVSSSPRIIHDFHGFPKALFDFNYPVAGDPALAKRVQELIPSVRLTEEWGLDHGSWSVLTHLFPNANTPVVQMSLDRGLSYSEHFELAKKLRPLRDEGILVIASGNIIHNLRLLQRTTSEAEAPEWALNFDNEIGRAIQSLNDDDLIHFEKKWPAEAKLAVPTPEHYIPLLYAAALRDEKDSIRFPIAGFQMGAIAMRTVLWQTKN